MPSFLNISRAYKRWRHGRGFGVHSPFAFRFITEVLNLPGYYTYYACAGIADVKLRTLFRIAVSLRASKVSFIGCKSGDVRATVLRAVPQAVLARVNEADFIVFDAAQTPKLEADAIPPSANVVIFNYKRWKAMSVYAAGLPAGMIFRNAGDIAVVAALPHLPRQDFDVKF